MVEIQLPTLDNDVAPAAVVIRHAVAFILIVFLGLAALAVAVSSVVTVNIAVDASGVLEPALTWPIRSQQNGTIVKTLVVSGDTVSRGQLLVLLDPFEHEATMAGLRTQIAELRLQLKRDSSLQQFTRLEADEQLNLARIALLRSRAALRQRLPEFGIPDNVDSLLRSYRRGGNAALDMAVADVEEAESRIRATDLTRERSVAGDIDLELQYAALVGLFRELSTAQSRASRLEIRSPARGVILTEQLQHTLGRRVQEGELVLELAELHSWQAELSLNERDVHKVHENDVVKMDIGALSPTAEQLTGRVIQVGRQPQSTLDGKLAGTYRVIVALDSTTKLLRRGYTVRAHIVAQSGRIIRLLLDHVLER